MALTETGMVNLSCGSSSSTVYKCLRLEQKGLWKASSYTDCHRPRFLALLLVCTPLLADELQDDFDQAMQAVDQNKLRTARERLTSLLTTNPSLSRARLELARVYYLSEDYPKAREEAQRVADDPNTPPAVRATVLAFLAQIDADQKTKHRAASVDAFNLCRPDVRLQRQRRTLARHHRHRRLACTRTARFTGAGRLCDGDQPRHRPHLQSGQALRCR